MIDLKKRIAKKRHLKRNRLNVIGKKGSG